MRIQHNIMAMNSYRNFSNNTSKLSKNLEKLSSGYRINRAGDDAAGLAISEKMRAQISGLEQAQSNAKSGVNLVQTAEGALTEVHDMLNRMVTLSEQSANGTYDDNVDRANLQKEFNQLRSEIDRIADSSNFNGINLLDGTQASKLVEYDSALGELLDKLDGTTATAATNATGTITLGTENNGVTTVNNGMFTDGKDATKAEKSYIKITGMTDNAADTLTADGYKLDGDMTIVAAGAVAVGGVAVQDVYDLYELDVDGNITDTKVEWNDGRDLHDLSNGFALVAKTEGKRGGLVAGVAASGGNAVGEVFAGKDEGKQATNTSATKYELTFDLDKLAAGQQFEVNGKIFELTMDPTGNDAGVTDIDISGFDRTTAAGKSAIANAIRTAVTGGDSPFATGFDASSVTTAADFSTAAGEKYTLTLTAQASGTTTNHGAVRVNEHSARNGAITSTYSAYAPAGSSADAGTYATAEYANVDLSKLQVGSTLTIGDKTLEIVDNSVTAGKGQITVDDLKDSSSNFKKLVDAFESAGYTAGKLEITGADASNVTIKITDTKVGNTAADFSSDAAKVGITIDNTNAKNVATFADADLNITFGETKVEDLLKAQIGTGNIELGKLFNVTVKDKDGNALAAGATIGAGATIELEAKVAGNQAGNILNALASTSANATAKVTNGRNVGEADNSGKATYELNFDLTKLAGGQKVTIGGKEISFINGVRDGETIKTNEINLQGKDLNNAADQQAVADAIIAALNDTTTGLGGTGDGTFTAAGGAVSADGKFSVNLTANNVGTASNLGAVEITAGEAGAITAAYNPTDGVTTPQTAAEAKVEYEFDVSKNRNGDEITIGSTTVKVVADDDANAGTTGFISETDAKDADKLVKAFTAAGYNEGTLSIADGKLTITGTTVGEAAADFAAAGGKVTVTNPLDDPDAMTGGLTLQIGDTSDDFNQLTVSIDAMDSKSLGIHEIDIGNQKGAQDAVAVIKAAINKVSNTRGDLGATQNRLDHTLNNLSVMQENIQDAEATIRDVDVAKEMMDYTKNNILVQSAQAMLAQANQVPQGVLQLLQ